MSKFTASKRRAKLLDPKCRVATVPIDERHPEWGNRFAIVGTNDRRLASASTISAAWKHASRTLDAELRARDEAEMISKGRNR